MAKLDQWNFLTLIRDLVVGGGRMKDGTTIRDDSGFAKDMNFSLLDVGNSVNLTDNTGGTVSTTLAAITAPAANATTSLTADMTAVKNAIASLAAQITADALDVTETNIRAQNYPASTTNAGIYTFVVPRDYDEATDSMDLHILAAMSGSTDTPTLTGAAYYKRPGSAAATITASVNGVALGGGTTALALSSADQLFTFNFSKASLKRNDAVTVVLTVGAHTTDSLLIYGAYPVYRSTLVSYNETDGTNAEKGNRLR